MKLSLFDETVSALSTLVLSLVISAFNVAIPALGVVISVPGT